MTVYYVDDGGSNTSPYDTWAKAAPTLAALQAGAGTALTTGGNVVYIGADSVSTGDNTGAADITFTGPANGNVDIVSATVGTTNYSKSSTNQIVQNGGDVKIIFYQGFSLYGIKMSSTGMIKLSTGAAASGQATVQTRDCTFLPGGNRQVELVQSGTSPEIHRHVNLTIYPDKDAGSNNRQFIDLYGGFYEFVGLTFQNSASGRNGPLMAMGNNSGKFSFSGANFGAIAAQTAIFSVGSCTGKVDCLNCSTLASPVWTTGTPYTSFELRATNCKSADAPEGLYLGNYYGSAESSTTVYRTGGARVENVPCSHKMVSNAGVSYSKPLYTPWYYLPITAAGTKTFTAYVAQDGGAGDLTDAEVWLEVEYMATANDGRYSLATDKAAYGAGAAQDDDTTSTWANITATYKQKLAVSSISVGEEGLCRARIGLGKASQTLYVDPLIVMS